MTLVQPPFHNEDFNRSFLGGVTTLITTGSGGSVLCFLAVVVRRRMVEPRLIIVGSFSNVSSFAVSSSVVKLEPSTLLRPWTAGSEEEPSLDVVGCFNLIEFIVDGRNVLRVCFLFVSILDTLEERFRLPLKNMVGRILDS